jgi:hypothetical protein
MYSKASHEKLGSFLDLKLKLGVSNSKLNTCCLLWLLVLLANHSREHGLQYAFSKWFQPRSVLILCGLQLQLTEFCSNKRGATSGD